MIELLFPWAFLALQLPWLIYRLVPAESGLQSPLYFPALAAQKLRTEEGRKFSVGSWNWRVPVLAIIWLLLVTAASQPRWIGEPVSVPVSGRDLLMAVDISKSMLQQDMEVGNDYTDRLTIVKYVVGNFAQRRQGDRLGLILFGSQAYLQAPLTFDRQTVTTLLQEARSGFAGDKTAIGDAIGIAIKRLRDRPAESRILILLTDGANTAGQVQPMEAASLAAEEGIRIHTIGVGADELVVAGPFGGNFGSRRLNPSIDLDEGMLQEIAELTGGQYFRARNPEELEQIYAILDQLEPIEQESETLRPLRSLAHLPLAVAMCLSTLLAALLLVLRSSLFVNFGRQHD